MSIAKSLAIALDNARREGGVREAVIARCFMRPRRNAVVLIALIEPPRTVAIGRAR
jgi:hypothetical protein